VDQQFPQLCQAAGEQPGHVHLRDPHGGGDLLLGLVVEEAQNEDAALALRELPQCLDQLHALGGAFDPRVPLTHDVRERGQGPLPSFNGSIEVSELYSALGTNGLRHRGFGQAAGLCDLRRCGRAPSAGLFEFSLRPSHPLPGLLHGARQPHESRPVPQVALQLSGDRRHRIGQESVAVIGVETVDGLDQTQTGHLEEVVLLFLAEAPVLGGDPAGHREQRVDGLLTSALPLSCCRLPPDTAHELIDLRGRERPVGFRLQRRARGGEGSHPNLCAALGSWAQSWVPTFVWPMQKSLCRSRFCSRLAGRTAD
jgi:hypothetical protein